MTTNYPKLSPKATAIMLAIIWGIATFVIALGGKLAMYLPAGKLATGLTAVMTITNPFYIFDMSTWPGVFLTTIEALIFWALVGYFAVWVYNKFV
ncbi:MAG: hypothetical protein ABIG93_00910 [archaeon]